VTFERELCAARPHLLAWARRLCPQDLGLAEDLAQETLLRAWEHRDQYVDKGNMKAWLFHILRNLQFSHYRMNKTRKTDVGIGDWQGSVGGGQEDAVFLAQVLHQMRYLTNEQVETLICVARGETYDKIASVTSVAVGTSKSRLTRARAALRQRSY
jgi:RNA polymerase sigma-70 factor (ECF subfamily)